MLDRSSPSVHESIARVAACDDGRTLRRSTVSTALVTTGTHLVLVSVCGPFHATDLYVDVSVHHVPWT